MKRILLSLFCLASASLFAQNVYIPDPDLSAYLLTHTGINTNQDTEISYAEAQAFTGIISAPNLNIQDLTGLEAFTNITEVFIPNNNINFANFSANTALTKISIGLNPLTTLDVTGLTNLTILGADYTLSLASVDLSTNVNLEVLNLNNNQLTSLDVSNNPNLINFSAGLNQLTTIDLSNNPAIESLSLHQNNLSSLDLSNQTNLIWFAVNSNNLTASSLTLPNTSTVTTAYLSDNPLGSIDVSNFTNLEILRVNNTNLSTIDLSSNTVLEELEAGTNNFTSIDLSALTQLTTLKLGDNDLSSIDLSNNPLIYTLHLQENDLTDLDFTNNLSLMQVYLEDNLFSSLDVSMVPAINELRLVGNSNLETVNMANGNNSYLQLFIANNCPNLSCVQIDNGFTPPATSPGVQWIMDPDKDPDLIYGYTTCSLGVENTSLAQLRIYPNPASDEIFIENLEEYANLTSLKLFSVTGQEVLSISLKDHMNKKKINIDHLSPGIYFLQVIADAKSSIFNQKIIKQ